MSTATPSTSFASKLHPGRSVTAIVAAVLLVGGGAYLYTNRIPRPASAGDFRPDPGGRGGGRFFANAPGVVQRPRDPVSVAPRTVSVRDGDMTISSQLRSEGDWNIYVSFKGESLGGADAQRLFLAVRRTVQSKQPPASLKMTDAQRAALAAVPLEPLELTPAQHRQLVDLLNQSQKLTANAPEMATIKSSLQALAAQVKTVDQGALKAKYAERDAKFRSILSAEQIDTLLGARTNNRRPANPPT